MKKLNVAILDDQDMVVEGVKTKLAQHPCVAAVVGTTTKNNLGKLIEENAITLLCLDLDLGEKEGNGLEVLKAIKKKFPALLVLIYTYRNQEMVCYGVQEAGADGMVSKNDKFAELDKAINTLSEGKPYYSTEVIDYFAQPKTKKILTLTATEIDVLKALAADKKQAEIAKEKNKTVDAIDNTVRSLRSKFNVHTTVKLVLEARKQGFID
jgi:DNA-binding NarL/FixJ family response regulator